MFVDGMVDNIFEIDGRIYVSFILVFDEGQKDYICFLFKVIEV